MARFKHGIMGPFQGKVGTVVGASWKGIPYMRSLPSKRSGSVSEKENVNRNKFAMAHEWLQPVLHFVRVGFKGYSERVEGFLAAKSYLLKNAFEKQGSQMVINPALVKVSYGNLPLSANMAITLSDGQFHFTWDTITPEDASPLDQIMILAYDIEHKFAIGVTTGQLRYTGADVLTIPPSPEKMTYHLYVAFVANDRSRQSDSVYLGVVEV